MKKNSRILRDPEELEVWNIENYCEREKKEEERE